MKAREKAQQLARRQELLALEAEVQRAALAATFAQWESKRALAWAGTLGTMAMRAMAIPRIRWLIIASVLARLKGKRNR